MITKFLFNQKFRFDMGQSFLSFINFTLLLITASDKIKNFFGIERTGFMVVIAVISGYGCVWLFGLFLDKVVRYHQHLSDTQVLRNPNALNNNARFERIENKLDQILKKEA